MEDPAKVKARRQRHYRKNRAKVLAAVKAYGQRRPDVNFAACLRRSYGMTVEQYEALLHSQGGLCRRPERRRYGSRYREGLSGHTTRLHVDHDHKSGRVRGLLCHACNAALGLLDDSARLLRAAVAYLER